MLVLVTTFFKCRITLKFKGKLSLHELYLKLRVYKQHHYKT